MSFRKKHVCFTHRLITLLKDKSLLRSDNPVVNIKTEAHRHDFRISTLFRRNIHGCGWKRCWVTVGNRKQTLVSHCKVPRFVVALLPSLFLSGVIITVAAWTLCHFDSNMCHFLFICEMIDDVACLCGTVFDKHVLLSICRFIVTSSLKNKLISKTSELPFQAEEKQQSMVFLIGILCWGYVSAPRKI